MATEIFQAKAKLHIFLHDNEVREKTRGLMKLVIYVHSLAASSMATGSGVSGSWRAATAEVCITADVTGEHHSNLLSRSQTPKFGNNCYKRFRVWAIDHRMTVFYFGIYNHVTNGKQVHRHLAVSSIRERLCPPGPQTFFILAIEASENED